MKKDIIGVLVFLCFSPAILSQSSGKVFTDMEGNKLSLATVDSLKKVYGERLRIMRYTNEQGKMIHMVKIPKQRRESGKRGLITTKYYNKNGVEIDKETFNSYVEQGYHFRYKVEEGVTSLILNAEKGDSTNDLENQLKERLLDTKYPEYLYNSISGNEFSIQAYNGKIVVLNFWFIGCRPCIKEIPILNNLVEEFNDREDVVFIAPALDGRAALTSFLKENNFNYKVAFDSNLNNENMGIGVYPTHVIVDKEGMIRSISIGAHEDIGSLLKGNIQKIGK